MPFSWRASDTIETGNGVLLELPVEDEELGRLSGPSAPARRQAHSCSVGLPKRWTWSLPFQLFTCDSHSLHSMKTSMNTSRTL